MRGRRGRSPDGRAFAASVLSSLAVTFSCLMSAGTAFADVAGGLPLSVTFNFVVFVVLLIVLLRKPLSGFFVARHERIEKAVKDAAERKAEADRLHEECSRRLADLGREKEEILMAAREEAARERSRILDRAARTAERIRRDALLAAGKIAEQAKEDLRRKTLDEAARRAGEILRARVGPADHRRFTDELIRYLEDNRGAGS